MKKSSIFFRIMFGIMFIRILVAFVFPYDIKGEIISMLNNFIIISEVLVIIFSLIERIQKNSTEKLLRNCINEKLNKNTKALYGKAEFDFYDLIFEIENILVENKLLENTDQHYYFYLLKQIRSFDKPEYKKTYFQQEKLMDKYGFTPFSLETIFNECLYNISINVKDKGGKDIYAQTVLFSKLMNQGYDNEDLLRRLISSVSERTFTNIIYRAPVILITMINIDRKYNENYKKH